ncbi:MAG: DNA ligase [Caldimonas sp.]
MSNRPCDFLRRRLILAAAAGAVLPLPARAAPAPAGAPASLSPALAVVYAGQVDPARCLVSEKYDNVRALWDGETLRHRSGRIVSAPASFLAALPESPLDGELWLGRGRFDPLSAVVRRSEPRAAEWAAVRYMVFELPGASGSFAERVARLAEIVVNGRSPQVELAPQRRVADRPALTRLLDETVASGGEGLVLHVAAAPYAAGRCEALLKLKPHLDAEAVVVGYRPGAGKYRGLVGALEVESEGGRRFLIGSGLSEALRRDPPALGAVITYRYRDFTPGGVPRFASYLRLHDPA